MKKYCFFVVAGLVCFDVFANTCPLNEKRFVSLQNNKVKAPQYDKANHLLIDDKTEWKMTTKFSNDVVASGVSQCFDVDDVNELNNAAQGHFCWCKVLFMDGYDVNAEWKRVEKYTKHKYRPHKQDAQETIEHEQQIAEQENIKDCWTGCAKRCLENLDTLATKIKSFGVCDKPLYKDSDIRCVINDSFVRIRNISVFDDVAQLEMDKNHNWILLNPQDSKSNEKNFIGMYNGNELHLKIVSDGDKVMYKTKVNTYSFQNCDKL